MTFFSLTKPSEGLFGFAVVKKDFISIYINHLLNQGVANDIATKYFNTISIKSI